MKYPISRIGQGSSGARDSFLNRATDNTEREGIALRNERTHTSQVAGYNIGSKNGKHPGLASLAIRRDSMRLAIGFYTETVVLSRLVRLRKASAMVILNTFHTSRTGFSVSICARSPWTDGSS